MIAAYNATQGTDDHGWKWWLSRVAIPLLAPLVAGIVILLLTSNHGGRTEPEGTISFPKDGSIVSRAFTAEGTLTHIPNDAHVWLTVQADSLLFPKGPEIGSQSRWILHSIEPGVPAGGSFSLVLLMVDKEGERQIHAWLARGRATGSYPGLGQITGKTLDTAADLILSR